jgi:hypothetical protein
MIFKCSDGKWAGDGVFMEYPLVNTFVKYPRMGPKVIFIIKLFFIY